MLVRVSSLSPFDPRKLASKRKWSGIASEIDSNDLFGNNVALSADGATLAVGAPYEDSNALGIDGDQMNDSAVSSGAVYVFVRDAAGAWSQQAYVKASVPSSIFGFKVALSNDGNTLGVSAVGESNTGAAYVFVRDAAGAWSQQARVTASNAHPADVDLFGDGLALSGDGDTLAVGAPYEGSIATGVDGIPQDNNDAPQSGAVYVFVRGAMGQWSQQAYVKASNTDGGDNFGYDVALSDDGDTLAVGALLEDGYSTGIDGNQDDDLAPLAGAVYVFERDAAEQWSQQAYVKASNTGPGDNFGDAVALSADGNTLVVSAPREDGNAGIVDGPTDEAAPNAGAAYVFVRDAMNEWSQQAYVKASNSGPQHLFGQSLALSSDGSVLVVGATGESSSAMGLQGDATDVSMTQAGAAYAFVRDATGEWSQRTYVKASNTGAEDVFGSSIALDSDGTTLAIGAQYESSNAIGVGGNQANDSASYAGAVFLY